MCKKKKKCNKYEDFLDIDNNIIMRKEEVRAVR